MHEERMILIKISRRGLTALAAILILALALLVLPGNLQAQKVQENYKEKFDITKESGGVALATSSDGKYVFVAGPQGVMVSDDHGKTGSWVQTVRLK